jgi:hypothetical protein
MVRAKFTFGLQPMHGLVAILPAGLFPNLMGAPGNIFVSDQGR